MNGILCVLIRIDLPKRFLLVLTTFLNSIYLPPELALWLILYGLSYTCLGQIYMVPKMFELLRFDCSEQIPTNLFDRISSCIMHQSYGTDP